MKDIREISQVLLKSITTVDNLIEDNFANRGNVYAMPFVSDFYVKLEDIYVDFKKKQRTFYLNPYKVYIMNFLGMPIIRGIRTKIENSNEGILAERVVKIEKLQMQKRDAKIYEKFPGTFITFGKFSSLDSSKTDLSEPLIFYELVLQYFTSMYSKSFVYSIDIKKGGILWHYNYLLPNVTSFLCVGELSPYGHYKKYIVVPSSMILALDFSHLKVTKKEILGEIVHGYSLRGYAFGVNPKTLEVRYWGPFPVFIPKINFVENILKKEREDILLGYFKVLILYNNDYLWISNNLQEPTGEIIVLSSTPFSPELYSLANFGEYEFVEYPTPFSRKYAIPIIRTRKELIRKISVGLNHAIIRLTRKIKRKKNNISFTNIISEEKFINKMLYELKTLQTEADSFGIYDPAFILYSIINGLKPSSIGELLSNLEISDRKTITQLQRISRFKKLHKLSLQILNIRDFLITEYDFWYAL